MKRLTTALLILVPAAVAGAVGYGAWRHYQPVRTIEQAVRERLKDPDSAQFSNITYNPATGAGCGFVNAKNAMGGYVGRRLFILFADGDLRMEEDEFALPRSGPLEAPALAGRLTAVLVDGYCAKK